MRVAVVENMPNTHIGALGTALAEAGAAIDWYRPWSDGALPAGPEAYDALVVLGGEQSAVDDADYPYLPALAALMRSYGDAEKSVLGICLGSQVLARGYGGENILNGTREFGWKPVDVTGEGRADPLFEDLGDAFRIFEWHSDTFTLPAGSVRLASTEAVPNQCFRIGRAVYGAQFHFEADSSVVDRWNVEFRELAEVLEPGWHERFPQTSARYSADADRAGLALARAFVRTIRPSVEAQDAADSRLSA
ncbi:type 1 glutamine amidotransferase [Rhizobium sp. 21-4511-3d]